MISLMHDNVGSHKLSVTRDIADSRVLLATPDMGLAEPPPREHFRDPAHWRLAGEVHCYKAAGSYDFCRGACGVEKACDKWVYREWGTDGFMQAFCGVCGVCLYLCLSVCLSVVGVPIKHVCGDERASVLT